eukprot:COSAG02_NODE_8_length_60691_cov_104.994752_39_plen_74_part_00
MKRNKRKKGEVKKAADETDQVKFSNPLASEGDDAEKSVSPSSAVPISMCCSDSVSFLWRRRPRVRADPHKRTR